MATNIQKNQKNTSSNTLLNNKSILNNNTKSSNNNTKSETNFKTTKEDAGLYEIVTDNYLILLGITSAIVIIIIIYFFSQTFRVSRTTDRMEIYSNFQKLTSLNYAKFGNRKIGDYYIASAYNTAHCGYQMYDYTSEKIVLSCLRSGARYLEFNIFNSEFGSKAYPVVSMGYKQGEWKMTINDIPLETIFEVIVNNAFKLNNGKEGVDNPDDPLFIGLNLNTNSNLKCLNLTAYLITKYFSERLLPNTYSFQNSDDIAKITLNQAQGKIIIFSSDGFQGSGLEEVVNYSWDNTNNNPNHSLQRLYYKDIIKPGFNKSNLLKFNKNGMTIIIPHQEGDFFTENYNPTIAFELGCQFISMNYQYIDVNMDYYITKFKISSLVLRDKEIRNGRESTPTVTSATTSATITTNVVTTTNPTTTNPTTTTRNN